MAGGRQHYNVTLAILAFAGTAYSLAQTIVVPALGTIQRDLHTTSTWATWALSSFLLVASVATPVLGRLGDQHGKELILVLAIAIFLVGCIGAAAAWNIWALIFFRGVQGTAGAIFPLAYGIIRDEFPPEKVAVGIGTISTVFGVGSGAGVLSAGLVVDHFSWRWVFVGASVVTATALVLVHRYVPESPIKTPSSVDFVGAMLMSAALICLLLALTEGNHWGWASARTLGLFAASVVVFAWWSRIELRIPEPLVDMRMLRQRTVLLTNVTAIISGFAMFGSFVLIPAFAETPRGIAPASAHLLHYGFDASVTKAGLYLLPSSATLLFSGPLAGAIGRRVGMKWPLSFGLILLGLTYAAFPIWHAHPWQICVQMAMVGISVGFAFAAMATLITQAVRPTETGIATGMNTVMRTVGSVIGAQLVAALLASYTIGRTGLPSVTAFEIAFWISAAVALLGGVVGFFVTPPRPRRTALAFAGAAGGK
jgi:MFS family permease